jgi:hypothetical protein
LKILFKKWNFYGKEKKRGSRMTSSEVRLPLSALWGSVLNAAGRTVVSRLSCVAAFCSLAPSSRRIPFWLVLPSVLKREQTCPPFFFLFFFLFLCFFCGGMIKSYNRYMISNSTSELAFMVRRHARPCLCSLFSFARPSQRPSFSFSPPTGAACSRRRRRGT